MRSRETHDGRRQTRRRASAPARVRRTERGMTLIMALLTLALMTLMGLALTMSSMSGILVSANYERDTRSFYLAEAGVSHALSVLRAASGDPDDDGTITGDLNSDGKFDFKDVLFASASQADGQLLNDARFIPAAYQLIPSSGVTVAGGRYTVQVFDDDCATVNYAAPATPPGENGAEADGWKVDRNNRVVVRSTGVGANGERTVIDAVIGFIPYPALLAEGNVEVGGSSVISGQYGSVHTNSNLTLGGSTSIEQSATASGSLSQTGGSASVGGFSAGSQPRITIPDLKPFPQAGDALQPSNFFIARSDVVLARDLTELAHAFAQLGLPESSMPSSVPSSGLALDTQARTTHSPSDFGWSLVGNGSNQRWSLASSGAVSDKTYFVYGHVECNGGTYTISVVATGHITANGNSDFSPYLAGPRALNLAPVQPPFARIDLLFLAGTDVKLNGTTSSMNLNGVIYAGEQVDLRGNGSFEGQIIARSRANSDNYIGANEVSGNFTLNFNNTTGRLGNLTQIAWRQVKQVP
jgi:hypothetical protein